MQVNRQVFRLAPPLILWWAWVVFVAANIADFAIQGGASARFAIVMSVILATVTGLAYALALRPRVIAEQAGLTVVNPFRDHHVPWAAIQAVDTGDWVRVHCAPGRNTARGSGPEGQVICCWALYISAGTKRKAARRVRPRRSLMLPGGPKQGFGESPRLPAEARYLASLPAAKAIAVRLDARASRERTRAGRSGSAGPVTARWAWPPIAAVALPALALLIVILA